MVDNIVQRGVFKTTLIFLSSLAFKSRYNKQKIILYWKKFTTYEKSK